MTREDPEADDIAESVNMPEEYAVSGWYKWMPLPAE
jgi:hypothetical protein